MRILGEFWCGNIEPTEYDTSFVEYKKLHELIYPASDAVHGFDPCHLDGCFQIFGYSLNLLHLLDDIAMKLFPFVVIPLSQVA